LLTEAQRRSVRRQVSPGLLAELEREAQRGYEPHRSRAHCETLAATLQRAGVDEVTIESLPWGPRHRYGPWRGPPSIEMRRAELWLLDDEDEPELLCHSVAHPTALMGAYRPTKVGGEIFEVVDVGDGAGSGTFGRQRLAGKVALVSGYHPRLAQYEALVVRGAEGLLCGPGAIAAANEIAPGRLLDPAFFTDHRPFGFNLSAGQYERLLRLLGAGKNPRVRVHLDLRLTDEERPLVRARLNGSRGGPKVVVVADLGETAAAGVALVAAIHGALQGEDHLALGRDLELLLVPGDSGAVWWLAEKEKAHCLVELRACGSGWQLLEPPPSCASVVSDLLKDHLEALEERVPIAESLSPLLTNDEIPSAGVSFSAGLSRAQRTDLVGAVAGAVLELTLLDEGHLCSLLAMGELFAADRLVAHAHILRRQLRQALDDESTRAQQARHQLWHAKRTLRQVLEVENQRLNGCSALAGGRSTVALEQAEVQGRLSRFSGRLFEAVLGEARSLGDQTRLAIKRRPLSALERRAQKVIVRRSYDGPFPQPLLPALVDEDDRQWLLQHEPELARHPHGDGLLCWADGERNLLEMVEIACLGTEAYDLKLLWRYLDMLASAKLVSLEIHTNIASVLEAP